MSTQAGVFYYLLASDSDIAPHKVMAREPSAALDETTVCTTLTVEDGDVLIQSFITPPGDPGVLVVPVGQTILNVFYRLDNPNALDTFFRAEFVIRLDDGTEFPAGMLDSPTLVSSVTDLLTGWIAVGAAAYPIPDTARVIFNLYAATSSPDPRTVTTFYEGSTHTSFIRSSLV